MESSGLAFALGGIAGKRAVVSLERASCCVIGASQQRLVLVLRLGVVVLGSLRWIRLHVLSRSVSHATFSFEIEVN